MRKGLFALLSCLICLLCTLTGSAVEKSTIAVIDFEAIGAEGHLGRAIAEIVRTEIIGTRMYRVVERSQMNRILSEQKMHYSGLVDDKNAVEIGKILGADKVVIGSVVRIGNNYTINARLIDVKTGEATLGKNVTGGDLNTLTDLSRELVDSLFVISRVSTPSVKTPVRTEGDYGKILFFEDFSSNKNNWAIYQNAPYYDTFFQDGRYIMETKNNRKSVEVIPLPSGLPVNYDVECVSIWLKGVNNSAYGLVLGESRESHYLFGVSGNGQSVIWVTENNMPKDDAMPWRAGTARFGDGRTVENRQRVEVRGNQLYYYVNDHFLTSIKSIYPLKVVGVSVSHQQRVAFTMLKITQR
ncbi:MAG TPA: FlgO family outer membrane protein [Syntrophales bacterium]|nr:FlgO family outer membrane protein [Syntrophales bacterium]HOL59215.1 FlgO family outer membrane protein [Syntrophales bacterium]HPO35265.1 FlgO family outer membrane protein [Syntrophales bacterium]